MGRSGSIYLVAALLVASALGIDVVVPTFDLLKVGANAGDLGDDIHSASDIALPVMGNTYINTRPQGWTVDKANDRVIIKEGGIYDVSASVDFVDEPDSVQNNCALEIWIEKNSTQISPYYYTNYFTRVNVVNKTSISIPATAFVFVLGDTIQLMVRAVSGDADCNVGIETSNSYMQFKKY